MNENPASIERLIRDYLRLNGVRVWEYPEVPHSLSAAISSKLNLPVDYVLQTLHRIRDDTIERQARTRGQAGDSMTVTLKVMRSESDLPQRFTHTFPDSATGADLMPALLNYLSTPEESTFQTKFIFKGKIIQPDVSLSTYGVKGLSVVMCFVTSVDKLPENSAPAETSGIKSAADVLTNRNRGFAQDEEYLLDITDQSGKPIKLPRHERKALTVALTLAERGKSHLKEGRFSDALFVFLEADEEFSKCKSEILGFVDNYALLQLDIVWCYLCLESADQLPDAQRRLEIASKSFKKTYGENLDRVTRIKGQSNQEQALFVRLYLLTGVVAFYNRDYETCRRSLETTKKLIEDLAIDEGRLVEMMNLGFSARECRLALRACNNEMGPAVEHVLSQLESRHKLQQQRDEKRRKNKLLHRLGVTTNGDNVSVEQFEALVSLGYPEFVVIEALRRFNNDIATCLQVLEDNLAPAVFPSDPAPDPSHVSDLTQSGFSIFHAHRALQISKGDLESARDILKNDPELKKDYDKERVGSGERKRRRDMQQEEEKAAEQLSEFIANDQSEYLDLDLVDENRFLRQFLALLESTT